MIQAADEEPSNWLGETWMEKMNKGIEPTLYQVENGLISEAIV